MINQIVKFTNDHSKMDKSSFRVTSGDILAFIAILYCRGLFCYKMPVNDMWSTYGPSIISHFMSRNRFLLIMKHIRFDSKQTRAARVAVDRFCLIREVWDRFIQNSQSSYSPGQFLTVDEQLVASKTRCAFTQFMPNKPDKFGIKLWMGLVVFPDN